MKLLAFALLVSVSIAADEFTLTWDMPAPHQSEVVIGFSDPLIKPDGTLQPYCFLVSVGTARRITLPKSVQRVAIRGVTVSGTGANAVRIPGPFALYPAKEILGGAVANPNLPWVAEMLEFPALDAAAMPSIPAGASVTTMPLRLPANAVWQPFDGQWSFMLVAGVWRPQFFVTGTGCKFVRLRAR